MITYSQDNMPRIISYKGTTTELFYDGSGARIQKRANGQTTTYVGGHYEIRGSETVIHIFAAGKRIASIQGGSQYFTHGDHLGSTSLVTNQNGHLVEEIGYLPFGATLYRKAYQGGTWSSVYQFTGQEFDSESDLYNYNARLYDPVTCRFITADTIVPDWTNPQSLNRYAYCRNNPLKYVDPSGHSELFAAIIIGAAIGMLAGGISAAMNGGDIMKGATTGAITGAISGALFYAGGTIAESAGGFMTKAAIHSTAGAVSGGVNAAITGGDIGQGMFIGAVSAGISAGMSKWIGDDIWARTFTGSVTGGVASQMSGGDFAQGAFQGAWTSAIAVLCNDARHKQAQNKSAGPTDQNGIEWVFGLGGGLIGVDASWDTSNPYVTSYSTGNGTLAAGGISFGVQGKQGVFGPTIHEIALKSSINVGIGKYCGVSIRHDLSGIMINVGYGRALPLSVSVPLGETGGGIGNWFYDVLHREQTRPEPQRYKIPQQP